MPIPGDPYDFGMEGKVNGKYWPMEDVLKKAVKEVLEKHHGKNPDRVESELTLKAGIGGDGFSGCCDRVGKDINLNTSSRYFVGLRISRIVGKETYDMNWPTEFFVETSQSAFTIRPLLIAQLKK